MKPSSEKSQRGFTLIELLVVMSIVGVLATTVIMTLNPAELIAQSRDAVRISDLSTIDSALGIYQTDVTGGSFGSSTVVYTSLPDSDPTCANQTGLPAGPTYHCVPTSTLRNADGTGWIPVDFTKISFGNPLSSLPVDPINTTAGCGSYYTYTPTWELTSAMSSTKYSTKLGNIHTAGPIQGLTPSEVTGRCGSATSTPEGPGGTYAWFPYLSDAPTRPADAIWNGNIWVGSDIVPYVLILDADNVPVAGATIECSASGTGNYYVGPFLTPTDSGGLAACGIFTSEVGSKSITITVHLPGGGSFTVHPTDEATHTTEELAVFTPPETAENSTVEISTTSLPADGYSQSVLTLTARDAENNPVPYAYTGCAGESLLLNDTYGPGDGFYRLGDGQISGVDGKMICRNSSDVAMDIQESAGFVGSRPNTPAATTYTVGGTTYDIRQGGSVVSFTTPGGSSTHTFTVDTTATTTDHYITGTVALIGSLGNPAVGVPVRCTFGGNAYDVTQYVSETDINGLLQCQFHGNPGAATLGARVWPDWDPGYKDLDGVAVDFTSP